MKKEEAEFIIETLETAIDWAEYATPYFQTKHNLDVYKEDVKKAIKLMRDFESRTCDSCLFYDDDCKVCTNRSVFGMDEDLKRTGAFSALPNFSCNRWEQK